MPYKAVFFDADGVLIRSKRQFTDRLAEDFGMDVKKMQPFFSGPFRECVMGRADLKEELAKVVEEWGWEGAVEELMEYWFTKGTDIDEPMAEVVRELRAGGIRTYLVTDQERYRGEHLRAALKGKLFDEVFFSAELGCRKNDLRYWQEVYEAVGAATSPAPIGKDEIFYVDDDPEDVATAREFGLSAYLYKGDLKALKGHLGGG